jgi:hypothetical protein
MVGFIITFIIGFLWLMYETKFLTIRLPRYTPALARLIGTMVAIVVGVSLIPELDKEVQDG